MSNKNTFTDRSYQLHEEHIQNQEKKGKDPLERLKIRGNINFWRHIRMYESLLPFLNNSEKWLTVGDGIGTDANWLTEQGIDVMATDIGDTILSLAQQQGFIQKFDKQNAEKITYSDNSFDYALCKEAYHHFPRPYLAVYEMLRVSKKAIILIEPQDPILRVPYLMYLKNILYLFNPTLLRKLWKNQYSFEEVGNYVYKVSEREIEKIAMGMGLPAIAFLGINDYFSTSHEMNQIPPNPSFWASVKRKIRLRDLLGNMGIIPHRLLCCVIFKNTPSEQTIKSLREAGYSYIELPPNPYA